MLVKKIMKVLSNLLGLNKKINASEIALKENGKAITLDDKIISIDERLDKISTFSEEEQVIGTWIDGKLVYRKFIIGTTPSTAGSWVGMAKISDDIDTLILLNGIVKSSATISTTIPKYESGSYNINLQTLNGTLRIWQNGYNNVPFVIVAIYTKSTD
jgi:hypothetical protein